jgi:predicted nucleic acid-binding protein
VTEPSAPRHALFVDSSAFLAAALTGDENHERARRIQARITSGGWRLVTTTYVLAELHALALARRDRRFALDLIDRIEKSSVLVVRALDEDWQAARAILHRYDDKDFSFTDALSFAVMDRLRIRVAFAFDRHFVQYGAQQADEVL